MIRYFNTPWPDVPTVWIDTETTGVRFGIDKIVEIGICRIERGEVVGAFSSRVNPGIPIPTDATEIHGITDADVAGAPLIEDIVANSTVCALLEGAQPGGYNCPFDREFVPPFGDWLWPWLDCLTLVRVVDRYAKGPGRHKLSAAAQRHGIVLENAHSAFADAHAAGLLFYKLAPSLYGESAKLGEMLAQQRVHEANEWRRFHEWLSRQEPRQ